MHAVAETACALIQPTAQGIYATAPRDMNKLTLTSLMDAQMSMNVSRIQTHALRLQLATTQRESIVVHVLQAES